ncbi:tetraspanin-13 isoform X2 [Bos indicus x Bos taurus]|uniref:tetraspanin-13 isoform X2 n=1 Tax=Bos indicus x Bos taurus TaxID=30522 RepID=UPI000F7D41B1|nr:tetraspanin-13 isoform X2 [Bos indicus x Bos taurus]XP_027395805.1 tetraspanin-13 isoform X2 [Bos indicus x Bos taurus]
MGHRLRVDFQSPCGRRGHRSWHLLVPDRVSGADRSCETPSGVAFFFYMIILLLVFIVQFSVSCACLALNQEQQAQLLEVGWNNTASARDDIQRNLNCCGFRSFNPNDTCLASCVKSSHPCSPCAPIIGRYAGEVLRFVGGIGLFFSFTEILGVWLTYRYRNQKDPRANPSAFL